MGLFDTIRVGDREGQVKLWDDPIMRLLTVGDEVPKMTGEPADRLYSIAMREGGYVNIRDGILRSWTDEPTELPVFDKYGDIYMGVEAHGPLDGVAGIRDRYLRSQDQHKEKPNV